MSLSLRLVKARAIGVFFLCMRFVFSAVFAVCANCVCIITGEVRNPNNTHQKNMTKKKKKQTVFFF